MSDPLAARDYYDAYWRSEGWETRPPQKLVALFERYVRAGDFCVDVGCGDGGTSGVCLSRHAARYVGVDVSGQAVQLARERGLDARQIEDAGSLPFDANTFDVAVCVEVLEHLFAPQLALTEIVRVTRAGGRVILTVPNAAHWRNRADALLGRWNPRGDHLSAAQPWRDAHLRFFTLRSLTDLARACGLRVLERGGFEEHPFTHYVPGARRLSAGASAGPAARRLAALRPGLLAGNLFVVAAVQPASTPHALSS